MDGRNECGHDGSFLNRSYLAGFGFRFSHRTTLKVSDNERLNQSLAKIEGKRLT